MARPPRKSKIVNITVFEYGLISSNPKAEKDHRVTHLPQAAFDYLRKSCLCDDSESRFLRLRIAHGMEALQVQNYAGVILCPDGTQIEVLPKVAKTGEDGKSDELARLSLLMMLKSLRQFRFIETETTSIKKQKMPLMEIFVTQFLNAVNRLVKKGIKSDYVKEQANSVFLKGKLLTNQQLKYNIINRHKFYVEYDAYLTDRAENRLIRSALDVLSSYTSANQSKKRIQALLFVFGEVPLSKDYKCDFSRIKLERGMQHYEAPMGWARLILEGFSPQSMLGKHNAYSLLFPMEAVFECFVAKYLKQRVPLPLKLSAQVQSKSLVRYGDKNYFLLKPDLYLRGATATNTVLDTKWKLIDQNKKTGKDKFGLSQGDFYQMLAYGHKYLNGEGDLVLIYPKTDKFDEPLKHSFDYDDESRLKLTVVPFDIAHYRNDQNKARIDLSLLGISNQ